MDYEPTYEYLYVVRIGSQMTLCLPCCHRHRSLAAWGNSVQRRYFITAWLPKNVAQTRALKCHDWHPSLSRHPSIKALCLLNSLCLNLPSSMCTHLGFLAARSNTLRQRRVGAMDPPGFNDYFLHSPRRFRRLQPCSSDYSGLGRQTAHRHPRRHLG